MKKQRKRLTRIPALLTAAVIAFSLLAPVCSVGASEPVSDEMQENGIAVQDIDGWPDGFIARYGDDFERAMNCIRKSPPRSKNPRASAYSKLMRKGYSAQVAAQVSAAWFEECKEIAADD